jgi:hypothetical protein
MCKFFEQPPESASPFLEVPENSNQKAFHHFLKCQSSENSNQKVLHRFL